MRPAYISRHESLDTSCRAQDRVNQTKKKHICTLSQFVVFFYGSVQDESEQ